MSWFAFAIWRGLQQLVLPTKALWLLHLSVWKCLCILPVLCFHGSKLYTNTTVKCGELSLEYNALVFRMWRSWNICQCHPTLIAPKFQSPFYFSVCSPFVFYMQVTKWKRALVLQTIFKLCINCFRNFCVKINSTLTFSYATYPFHISINPINQIFLLAV